METDRIDLGEVLLRTSQGTLARAQHRGADVLLDSRRGAPSGWARSGPPAALLWPLDTARLDDGPAVVYPGFDGRPLHRAVEEPLPPETALRLLRQLVEAVAWLHHHGRHHLELVPAGVLVDGDRVRLLGAGHTWRAGREHATDSAAGSTAAASLGYIAPEQTGRVSRPVDGRTDLYGLGALGYHLLTGRAPFESADRVELVHAVIALDPAPLRGVPPMVSRLIGRLLAKDALDRYQTAPALLADLDRILAGLQAGDLQEFTLGAAEPIDHLPLPDGLYGREAELAQLLGALDAAAAAEGQLLLVSGPAGSGKTALIHELHQRPTRVVAGKFDPSDLGRPYAALGRALDSELARLLALPDAELAAARERIESALGGDIGVLTGLLPRLVPLVGAGTPVPQLEPGAAQARLSRSLAALLMTMRRGAESLVLVVDDLQWADRATFELLERFLAEVPQLLVVGAYRPEEVDPDHPLTELVGRRDPEHIQLGPLPEQAVRAFVAATLRRRPDEVAALADDLARRTRGNPFALRWSLKELHRRGAIVPGTGGGWRWLEDAVGSSGVADNIAPLLATRIGELGDEARDLLRLAAVGGTLIEPPLLSAATGTSVDQILDLLGEALDAELVEAERVPGGRRYRFAHDRIREAALASMDPPARAEHSLALGRALLAAKGRSAFETVALLNPLRDRLEAPERARLAVLNMQAAADALEAHALEAARDTAAAAWELLGPDPWSARDLALRCRDLQMDLFHQLGERDSAETYAKEVLAHCGAPEDASHAYDILISSYAMSERVLESLDACYAKLAAMGQKLPRRPNMGHVMLEMTRTMWALRGKSIEELLDQPPTDNRAVAACTRTVSQMGTAVESAEQYLQLALRGVRLTVAHGPSRGSAFCYSSYGTILCGPFGKLEEGDRYGQLGLALVRKLGARDVENRVMINYYSFVAHWTHPWADSIPALEEARRSALSVGDVTYLPGATMFVSQFRIFAGLPLASTANVIASYVRELEPDQHNHRRMRSYQAFVKLMVEPPQDDLLAGFEGLAVEDDALTTVVLHTLRGAAALLHGRFELASVEFDLARPLSDNLFGLPLMAVNKFYDALVALDGALRGLGDRKRLLKRARGHRNFLAPRADVAPFNLAHRVALLDAELARVEGAEGEAARHYARAAELAAQHGFLNDLGLIWQRSAGFHEACDRPRLATRDGLAARRALEEWGAFGVLATSGLPKERVDEDDVDLETVLRAGEALGQDLHLDRLLARLTRLLLTNAGGQRAVVVVSERHRWTVVAMETEQGHTRPGTPLAQAGELLCLPLVRYCLRTGEERRVDDATQDPAFAKGRYVQETGARSMLALPMISSGRTTGLIYLEHRAMRAAFEGGGAQAMSLLAAQIGVALQNAQLFEETEGLKRAYERFVPKQMLEVLGKGDITEVDLGDNVESEMTVLFSDIRSFTKLSEEHTPSDTFALLNDYLGRMEPIITARGGFIDKYIGDAIMAVFPNGADAAVAAASEMLTALAELNEERAEPLSIGVGIHHGPLMLGTVGGRNRMEGTVIGDTVNVASRVEGQTKREGNTVLVTAQARDAMNEPGRASLRSIGLRNLRGRDEEVELFTLEAPSSAMDEEPTARSAAARQPRG